MGHSGDGGSPELRSRWSSQGKEAMAQVCLGHKHFLFGQGWVDGFSLHPMANSKRFLCVCVSSVCGSSSLPVSMYSSVLFSLQMEAQVCAKFPHPKEPSCGTWAEESIVLDW